MLFWHVVACSQAGATVLWLSYLVGVADPVVEWFECLLVPTRILLDM